MDLFFWIIAALLAAIGIYMNYRNWKTYFESRKAKEVFLKNHPDSRTVKMGTAAPWVYLAMCVVCVLLSIFLFTAQELEGTDSQVSQGAVYLGLAIFALAMMAESLTDSKVAVCPEGYMVESEYIRWKSIRTVTVGKGLFKSSSVTMFGGKEEPVTKSMAKWVEEELNTWKASRKDERSSRKQRRAAAREARK